MAAPTVLALLLALAPAAQDAAPTLEELVGQVKEQKDEVALDAFQRIAAFKSAAAFAALRESLDLLEKNHVISRAYTSFSAFRRHSELEDDVIAFLLSDAFEREEVQRQQAAAQALMYFQAAAHPALLRIVRTHPLDTVRSVALQPIVPLLGESGTPEDVRLIVRFATLRGGRSGDNVATALGACTGPQVDEILIDRLHEDDLSPAWTEMLLRVLAPRTGEAVTDALVKMLKHESPYVRTRVLEILGERADPALYTTIQKFLKSKDGLERRQAIIAMTSTAPPNKRWPRKLHKLARSKDVANRMGAAVGLARIADETSLEVLYGLIDDDDWRVRLEVIDQLAELRRKDSLPLLVARLGDESGRMRGATARALRRITALDHGTSPGRWTDWWAGEGEAFVVPPLEVALAAQASRKERASETPSSARFYGIPLVGEHVVFVVDRSGSMTAEARNRGRSVAPGDERPATTRLDVAKDELASALKSMEVGVWFNLIFFDSGVSAWEDELVRRQDRVAEKAIAFARAQRPGGATNLHGGLMLAFKDLDVDTIYLLSDGAPSAGEVINPDQIRAHVQRVNALRKVQIHCIAVGHASPFLAALAEENGGRYVEAL